ncbi:DUF5627 domain-containing protein [Bacteroidota bacterium]
MKKIYFLLSITVIAFSCSNQDIEFDDYENNAVYFPYQSPLRTLILGDEVIGDNTIDLEHAFSVGAAIGGMYENLSNREVMIELAPELADGIVANNDTLEILPSAYYDATFDKITIPQGRFFGKLRVNLNDAFFNDPKTIGLYYVLPLRIIDTDADSILSGQAVSLLSDPDPRVTEDWDIPPQNYTLFGIKYINPYHGVYLLRGFSISSVDTLVYSERFLTDNGMVQLSTKTLDESVMSVIGGNKTGGKFSALLSFNESNKTITVSQTKASSVVINGTGKYFTKDDPESESYTDQKHRTIYLDYTYEDGGTTYQVNDSLVFIDTGVIFEEFSFSVLDSIN